VAQRFRLPEVVAGGADLLEIRENFYPSVSTGETADGGGSLNQL
jgi:hypothetical protein